MTVLGRRSSIAVCSSKRRFLVRVSRSTLEPTHHRGLNKPCSFEVPNEWSSTSTESTFFVSLYSTFHIYCYSSSAVGHGSRRRLPSGSSHVVFSACVDLRNGCQSCFCEPTLLSPFFFFCLTDTPWSRFLLETLIVSHLIRACHLSLS